MEYILYDLQTTFTTYLKLQSEMQNPINNGLVTPAKAGVHYGEPWLMACGLPSGEPLRGFRPRIGVRGERSFAGMKKG